MKNISEQNAYKVEALETLLQDIRVRVADLEAVTKIEHMGAVVMFLAIITTVLLK